MLAPMFAHVGVSVGAKLLGLVVTKVEVSRYVSLKLEFETVLFLHIRHLNRQRYIVIQLIIYMMGKQNLPVKIKA